MSSLFESNPITLTISGNKHSIARHYRFLWAKYVNGFNGGEHCAKCLKGKFSSLLGLAPKTNTALVFDESDNWDYIYLCGVDKKGYKYNLHLPVRFKEGSTAEISDSNGITFTFTNAEKMDIPEIKDGFMDYDRSYTTCRNFRFGFAYYGIT